MDVQTTQQLAAKHCVPCEGGVDKCPLPFIQQQLETLEGWSLTDDGLKIIRSWKMKNFVEALTFCNRVGEVAEAEGHHPDLHLESWCHVRIEIWTHAIGGLSENDFILAARINQL